MEYNICYKPLGGAVCIAGGAVLLRGFATLPQIIV